jgi:hypothetical protein
LAELALEDEDCYTHTYIQDMMIVGKAKQKKNKKTKKKRRNVADALRAI